MSIKVPKIPTGVSVEPLQLVGSGQVTLTLPEGVDKLYTVIVDSGWKGNLPPGQHTFDLEAPGVYKIQVNSSAKKFKFTVRVE